MLRVRTIDAVEIWLGDRRLAKQTERALALAVYLCVRAQDQLTRAHLVEMFWPESTEVSGRHNLRQMLYRLRKMGLPLGEEGESISVRGTAIECDLARTLTPGWADAPEPELLDSPGRFLPGFETGISRSFSEWREDIQTQVTAQFRRAGLEQTKSARKEGRWAELDHWARLVLRHDPLNEEATLARAESAAMSGSKALALEILDNYVEDLGDRTTQIGLPASILRRRISERGSEWGGRATNEVTLVGRSSLMRRLTGLIELAKSGRGDTFILYGAPGIGKTRLCLEARQFASMLGFRCIAARSDPSLQGRPLSLLAQFVPLAKDLPGAAACPPAAMSTLNRVADSSGLLDEHERLGSGALPLAQIAWALTEAITAASQEAAILVHLDDVHNCDDESMEILGLLSKGLRERRAALLVSARSHWTAHAETIPANWQHCARIHVPPLSAHDSLALAASLSGLLSRPLSPERQEQIAREAGGNPLFLRELTAHRSHSENRSSRPISLAAAIEQRCAMLSSLDLRLLRIAGILGRFATPTRVRAVHGDTPAALAERLEALERDGLLHLDESGALALHECWREAIDADIPRSSRAVLAQECAEVLAGEGGASMNMDVAWQCGRLFEIAGLATQAMSYFALAGDRLLAMGVPAQAAQAFTSALEHASDPSDVAKQLQSLATSLHTAGRYAEAVPICQRALRLIPQIDSANRTVLTAILSDSEWRAHNRVSSALEELAQLVAAPGVPAAIRNFGCLYGVRLTFPNDGKLSRRFAENVVIDGDSVLENWVGFLVRLISEAEEGQASSVRAYCDKLNEVALASLPHHSRALALRMRSIAFRHLGDLDEAVRLGELAVEAALFVGHASDASAAALSLAYGYLDHGLADAALEWIEKARRWHTPVNHDERERAFRHAEARYLIVKQRYRECIALHRPHLDGILSDGFVRRRAAEVGCIAISAAAVSDFELADRALDLVLTAVTGTKPGFSLDFSADCAAVALRLRGRESEAERVADDYVARRSGCFDRPLAPGLRELRGAAGRMAASPD